MGDVFLVPRLADFGISTTGAKESDFSSKSAAEVTEINSSQKGNVNVSDDQVESQPDEKTAASKVG